jgi:hypothetical protein
MWRRRIVANYSVASRSTLIGAVNWGFLSIFAAATVVFCAWKSTPAQYIGPIGVVSIFLVCLTFGLAELSHWSDRNHVPYMTIVFASALAFSLANLNDNHQLRELPAAGRAETAAAVGARQAPNLQQEFKRWFDSRRNIAAATADKPLPVYIVAAQGGGIRAALQITRFLGNVQDNCPLFGHHLFAISGVSGGSVGAAVFAALTSQLADAAMADAGTRPCIDLSTTEREFPSFLSAVDDVLSYDLLAPALAGMFFPDFVQRLLPYPFPALDRARWFENALEAAVERTLRDRRAVHQFASTNLTNIMSRPFREHWSATGNSPALILNATEVGSGRRRLMAPFTFAENVDSLRFMPIWGGPGTINPALSTAAYASARFPWISPAGWFREPIPDAEQASAAKTRTVRLVDGGYFDNSGVTTALDLMRSIEAASKHDGFADRVRINLIVLTGGEFPRDEFFGLSELIAPVQALLNARTGGAYSTVAQAERELNGDADQSALREGKSLPLRRIQLRDLGYPSPLGWRSSWITSFLTRVQSGDVANCAAHPADQPHTKLLTFDADCVLASIRKELLSYY